MDIAKVIQRLFYGVDFNILNQCVDEKVRFIKYEMLILVLTGLSCWSFSVFAREERVHNYGLWTTLLGVMIFATYKLYLSNLHLALTGKKNGFVQWLVATLFALGNAYCFITGVFNISLWQSIGVSQIVMAGLVLILSLVFYYLPVRFHERQDGQYAKMLNMTLREEAKWAELAIADTLKQETLRRKMQSELNNQVEQLSSDMVAHEIANARTRVAKEALAKWEAKQKEIIKNNPEIYIQ